MFFESEVKKIFHKTLILVFGINSCNHRKCVRVVARLPQILKSTFFEIFSSSPQATLRSPHSKKFQRTLILTFEANIMASLNCTIFKNQVHCVLAASTCNIWNSHNSLSLFNKFCGVARPLPNSMFIAPFNFRNI